jgi:hypothetical protein
MVRQSTKNTLLQLFSSPHCSAPVRRTLAGVILVVAQLCTGSLGTPMVWPELLHCLEHTARAGLETRPASAAEAAAALDLRTGSLSLCALLLGGEMACAMRPHFVRLQRVVGLAMADEEAAVRSKAVEAAGAAAESMYRFERCKLEVHLKYT